MCDIKQKTDLKERTIYKCVIKRGDEYISPFAYKTVCLGVVNPLTPDEYHLNGGYGVGYNPYQKGGSLFNKAMVGLCSGFATLRGAQECTATCYGRCFVIIKMRIGGDIWKGTSKNIWDERARFVTYAGSEILSFVEINP